MVHEIREKNLFTLARQSAQEIGYKTLSAYGFMAALFMVIVVTFILAQTKQNIVQNASFDASTRTFTDTFDGNPTTPQPFTQVGQNNWDVQIHTRGELYKLEEMDAMHGGDCGAPPASHHLTGIYEDSVFNCRNHIMTALNSGSYGVIYLTPNSMIDFGSGDAVLMFELSTEKMSSRDWWDVTVSPFLDSQALPLLSDLSQGVDLQKPNNNSVVIATDNGEGGPNLKVVTNGNRVDYDGTSGSFNRAANEGITAGTNQMATRQPFKLTISRTHIKFERLASTTGTAIVFVDRDIPALSWSQGTVQLGHHSYNPFKDNSGVAATWHWDAVTIQPAIPFSMIKANRRFVDSSNPSVSFNSPAPANSYLRFSGYCAISVDGVRAQKMTDDNHPEHMSSYMMPITAGKQNFNFSFGQDGWFNQDCIAKDFAIWSTTTSPTGPTPTTSTITPTVIPTTITTPTATRTPTPTLIPAATTKPSPTAKSTLSLIPATSLVTSGQTFTTQVRLNTNGQSVNAVELEVLFPANLTAVSIADGAFEVPAAKTITNGKVTLAYGSTTPKTGTQTVATITFRANSAGSAQVTIGAATVAESTSNTDVLKTKTGATYTIVAPTPTPSPTSTPSPTPTPTPVIKAGDLNSDNKVDIQDLSYLLTKWGTVDSIADMNKDGKVNTLDLSLMLSNWGK